MTFSYLHLTAGQQPPALDGERPFKAVVVIEDEVRPAWRDLVSDWLVKSGCLYMMAWGKSCSEWDDSVGVANLAAFEFRAVPDDAFVMTTWHDDEALGETFRFAEKAAMHPTVEIEHTLIVDISPSERRAQMSELFEKAIRT